MGGGVVLTSRPDAPGWATNPRTARRSSTAPGRPTHHGAMMSSTPPHTSARVTSTLAMLHRAQTRRFVDSPGARDVFLAHVRPHVIHVVGTRYHALRPRPLAACDAFVAYALADLVAHLDSCRADSDCAVDEWVGALTTRAVLVLQGRTRVRHPTDSGAPLALDHSVAWSSAFR